MAMLRTGAKTTSDFENYSPSPRPSPIGWERENRPPSAAYPTALERARDRSGCSLSRRTGEGQGEGHFVRNTPPFGRRFFLAQTSLLAPYRPVEGMRVARASSGPKTPRRKRDGIYEMGYLEKTGAPTLAEAARIRARRWLHSRQSGRQCRPAGRRKGE